MSIFLAWLSQSIILFASYLLLNGVFVKSANEELDRYENYPYFKDRYFNEYIHLLFSITIIFMLIAIVVRVYKIVVWHE